MGPAAEIETNDVTTPEIETEVEEKIMDDETTTPAKEIETDDLTTPEIETEVTLRPAMPRLDTSEEVSTTVVVEEVPAITTVSPIVEPSEETGSDIEDLDTTTMTSIDAASVDTESEVEATETTLSSIDKKPLDTSSETE